MFVTAPMSSPPALPPVMISFDGFVYLCLTSASAAAMKSVNVFFLVIMRPASCHSLPRSPPPRMCASAQIAAGERRGRRSALKGAFKEEPYEPYAVSHIGLLPLCGSMLFL